MDFLDLKSLTDFRSVVELEKLVWGFDAEDVVPVPMLVITVKRGGILVGAFDDRGEMVGFVYSLPGFKAGRPTQWSHMLGVVPEHRSVGLGYRLKLEQRQRALDQGIELVEWTYDPLQALNAHFNFRKLGVVVKEYAPNVYGDSSSPLHRGNPTDRFVAEWWIRSPEVTERIARGSLDPAHDDLESVPLATRATLSGRWLVCEAVDLSVSASRLGVEIPIDFSEMLASSPDLARDWRSATREVFAAYLGRGYRVVDFVLQRELGRGRYLLSREDARCDSPREAGPVAG